jgi:hypothetical protein
MVAYAGRLPQKQFVLGGSLYPEDFPWAQSVYYGSPPRAPCAVNLPLAALVRRPRSVASL